MIKKDKLKDLHYSVSGTIAASDLQKIADEVLTEFGKTAKMPGFRQGHILLEVAYYVVETVFAVHQSVRAWQCSFLQTKILPGYFS